MNTIVPNHRVQPLPILSTQKTEENKPKLVKKKLLKEQKWLFSFKFWKQIDYFGVGDVDSKWFVSLLEKLQDLSKKDLDKFFSNSVERDRYRYHNIDWNSTNIPIGRSDLYWIEEDYLSNAEEFPIVQFQISMALGRIVGFLDETNVFNIVLLDPLHNIQPSRHYAYKVDPTSPLICNYSSLLAEVEKVKVDSICSNATCGFKSKLSEIPTQKLTTNILMHYIDNELLSNAEQCIADEGLVSITDLIEVGIMYYQDSKPC